MDSKLSQSIEERLERRLGRLHSRLRLGIEADHEAQVFGHGINYFHIENLPSIARRYRLCLTITGFYGRGQRNATQIELRQHDVVSARLPEAFDGFTLLQLSDLHVEMSEGAMMRLAAMLPGIDYDLCVLTGDYRAQTFGAYDPALAGMEKICSILKRPIYGVLGNHDTIRMVPGLEDMGIQMLLNENHAIERGDHRIYLAGIDDAHFYRVDNIEKAATGIPMQKDSRSSCRIPQRSISRLPTPISACSSADTHTGDKSAFPVAFRLRWTPFSHVTWALAHGNTVK